MPESTGEGNAPLTISATWENGNESGKLFWKHGGSSWRRSCGSKFVTKRKRSLQAVCEIMRRKKDVMQIEKEVQRVSKVCPLLLCAEFADDRCRKGKCAWWDAKAGACALAAIAENKRK